MTSSKEDKGNFHAALNLKDFEIQTEGCRPSNPDICSSHFMPKVRAFSRSNGVCLKPTASWRKRFRNLSEIIAGETKP